MMQRELKYIGLAAIGLTTLPHKEYRRFFIIVFGRSSSYTADNNKKVWSCDRLSDEGNLAKPANEQTLQHHTRKDIAVATAQAMPIPGGRVVVIPVCLLKIAKFYQLGLAKHFH